MSITLAGLFAFLNPIQIKRRTHHVESKSKQILEIRDSYSESSLADLYDPIAMPPKLVKAHQELDKAVDLCYRSNAFPNDIKRIEFLFELYEKYTDVMFNTSKKKKN